MARSRITRAELEAENDELRAALEEQRDRIDEVLGIEGLEDDEDDDDDAD